MLSIYFLQQWFNLSHLAGIDLGREPVPDETTVCKFRHLLESHDLGRQLFEEVHEHLEACGLTISTGYCVRNTADRRGRA